MKHTILNIKEESYSSKLDLDTLKNKIENLYYQKRLRLGGRIINKNEFVIYDKQVVIGWSMPNLRRKSAYLKGKIIAKDKGTNITLTTKPNSILPIFAILSALAGITITLITNSDNKFYFMFGLALVAIGIIYYPLSIFIRNRLQNKIVKHLNLNKL